MKEKNIVKNENQKILNCKQLVNAFPKIDNEMLEKMNNELNEVAKFPMYYYIPDIMKDWIKMFHNLELVDTDYLANLELIANKPIQELTIDETLTKITLYIQTERFCGGFFMNSLNEGILQELVTHLQELI